MVRDLSIPLHESINALISGNPWGYLFELTIMDAPSAIRLAHSLIDIVFHGLIFTASGIAVDDFSETETGILANTKVAVTSVTQEIISLVETYWRTVINPNWIVKLWYIDMTQPNEIGLNAASEYQVTGITLNLVDAVFDLAVQGVTLTRKYPYRLYTTSSGFPYIPRARR